MPQLPVDQRARCRRDASREMIWEEVWARRRVRQGFTARDIAAAARGLPETIRAYLRLLVRGGFLERITDAGTKPQRFVLTAAGLAQGREVLRVNRDGRVATQGCGRAAMWRTLPILKEFDAQELARAASTADHTIAVAEAKSYLYYLDRAGYLRIALPGGPQQAARYRHVPAKRTGPKPPQVQRVKQVWDPNLQRVVWPEAET